MEKDSNVWFVTYSARMPPHLRLVPVHTYTPHMHVGGGPFAHDGRHARPLAKIGNSGCEFTTDSRRIAWHGPVPAIVEPRARHSRSAIACAV